MRIPISCMTCGMEALDHGEPERQIRRYLADVTDDGIYELECEKGHKTASVLQHPKYEILFQSAAVAHLYGFHREAVGSAATALERFFEFACQVFWDHQEVSRGAVAKTWREMVVQSERQLGAFLALHLVSLGAPFPWNDLGMKKLTETRNRVVHRGCIPTRDEAENYLRGVFGVIVPMLDGLHEAIPKSLEQVRLRSILGPHKTARERTGKNVAGMGFTGVVVSRSEAQVSRDFDARMTFLRDSLWNNVMLTPLEK